MIVVLKKDVNTENPDVVAVLVVIAATPVLNTIIVTLAVILALDDTGAETLLAIVMNVVLRRRLLRLEFGTYYTHVTAHALPMERWHGVISLFSMAIKP